MQTDPMTNGKRKIRAARISLATALSLATLKVLAALATGSLAVLAGSTSAYNAPDNPVSGDPVIHGYVTRLGDWPWSSFHDHVAQGWIEPDWGTIDSDDIVSLEAGE